MGTKFQGRVFDRARMLCQDSEIDIRKVMTTEVLQKICAAVGNGVTESMLYDKIMELIYDSDCSVKVSAIELLVNILEMLPLELRKNKLTNLFLELMININEEVIKTVSFHCGKIAFKVTLHLLM